jgi:hypothetical protein
MDIDTAAVKRNHVFIEPQSSFNGFRSRFDIRGSNVWRKCDGGGSRSNFGCALMESRRCVKNAALQNIEPSVVNESLSNGCQSEQQGWTSLTRALEMGRVGYSGIVLLIAGWLAIAPMVRAAEEEAAKSLTLILEGACDPKNSRLFVESKHATRTIIATLRWNLSGSKRIATDQFQVAPNARVEIGCAAQADIVSAVYAE